MHSNYCKSRSDHIRAAVPLPLSLQLPTGVVRADDKFVLMTQGSTLQKVNQSHKSFTVILLCVKGLRVVQNIN